MSHSQKKFATLVLLLITTRILDGITTFIGSPDLKYETNPVVKLLHGGWIALGITTGGVTFFLITLAYYHYFKPLNYKSVPRAMLLSLTKFTIYTSFGPNGKLIDFLYRTPKLNFLSRMIGYVGGYTLVYYGMYCIINNIILIKYNFITPYWIEAKGDSLTVQMSIIIILFLYLGIIFLKKEHQKAIKQHQI